MKKIQEAFGYELYAAGEPLPDGSGQLLQEARRAALEAYAPYSRFRVGAAALLENGKMVLGSNQENISYPAGLCAERVLLSAVSSLYPQVPISSIAISYLNALGPADHPISPCGICRQSLLEYERRMHRSFRIILGGSEGTVIIVPSAASLLPLAFSDEPLGNLP
jgi:cytidine deaminase